MRNQRKPGRRAILAAAALCMAQLLQAAPYPGPLPGNAADWDGLWAPDGGISFSDPNNGPRFPAPLRPEYAARERANLEGIKHGDMRGDPTTTCVPSGMPRQLINPYPMEVVFAPGRVIFLFEYMSQVRRVFTDGRKHPEEVDPSFNGHSIGHWEGDTLVVDTVGLRDDTMLQIGMPHSERTQVTERYRVVGRNTLESMVTITDPVALSAPWTIRRTWTRRPGWEILEYICEENNRGFTPPDEKPAQQSGAAAK